MAKFQYGNIFSYYTCEWVIFILKIVKEKKYRKHFTVCYISIATPDKDTDDVDPPQKSKKSLLCVTRCSAGEANPKACQIDINANLKPMQRSC